MLCSLKEDIYDLVVLGSGYLWECLGVLWLGYLLECFGVLGSLRECKKGEYLWGKYLWEC